MMYENGYNPNEIRPNDPKLFQAILRHMSRFTIENGVDTMTEPFSDSFREWAHETGNDTGPNLRYSQRNKAFFDVLNKDAEIDFVPDSKQVWGHVDPEGAIDDKTITSISVLGEGAGIQHGEYGSICLMSAYGFDQDIYDFKENGTVEFQQGYNLSSQEERWEEPRQATDEELLTLRKLFDMLEPGFPNDDQVS